MAKAEAPKRASGKLTIQFGLVAIPVKVYSGIEDTALRRKRFHEGRPVGNVNVDKETGEVIKDFELMYECSDGSLVTLTDEEIELVGGSGQPGIAEVVGFVAWDNDHSEYVEETRMQVRPEKTATKAFALLTTVMAEDGLEAVIRYTLRGRTRYGLLDGEGTMRVLRFEEELRKPMDLPKVELTDAEKDMARTLVQALGQNIPTAFTDEATVKVREYAETKAAGGEAIQPVEVIETAEVDNLMAALQASVEAAKK